MSNGIDRKTRCCAMSCHLAILSGAPLIISILAVFPKILPQSPKVEQNLNNFFGFLFFSPSLGCILSIILTMIIWRKNRHYHPFIEESGQEVVNCLLSITFYLFTLDSIVIAGCGFGEVFRGNIALLLGSIATAGIYAHVILVFLVSINAIAASIQAAKGKLFHYPCVIHFFR